MDNWKTLIREFWDTTSKPCDEPLIDDDDDDDDDDDSFDFHVLLKLKHNGMIGFDFNWAEDVHPAMSAQAMASFLHAIQSGQIVPQVIDGLKGHGIQTETSDMTNMIVQKFLEISQQHKSKEVAISPHSVFNINKGGER